MVDIRKKSEVLSELDKLYSLVEDYRKSESYKRLQTIFGKDGVDAICARI